MSKLSIGKTRGLQEISSPGGIFTICAMDHRGSLRSMIDKQNPQQVGYEAVVERKLELCSTLAEHASAVLLDPVFGAAQCIGRGLLPKSTGLLVSIEATGYSRGKEGRLTRLLNGWGVEKIKRMGASAVKLLVYYRPDLKQSAREQLNTVSVVGEQCITYDIPFLVESKSYPVGKEAGGSQESAARRGQLVLQTARDMGALPIDVLKAEFPADLHYQRDRSEMIDLCRQLDRSCRVPWVVLSGGVEFEVFCQQVEIACQAGASGFAGGRAIWQEAIYIDDARERVRYLSTVGVDRLKRLTEIADRYAVPWYKKYGVAPEESAGISERWYREY